MPAMPETMTAEAVVMAAPKATEAAAPVTAAEAVAKPCPLNLLRKRTSDSKEGETTNGFF